MSSTKALSDVIREWSEVFMRRSGGDFRRFMGETGLSFSHLNVMMRLYHGGKSGVTELGGEMGVTNAAASQAIDRLVHLGLITRSEDPDDRRAKQLVLTQQGRDLVAKGIEARSRGIEELTTALSAVQQEMIISALTLLTAAARKLEG